MGKLGIEASEVVKTTEIAEPSALTEMAGLVTGQPSLSTRGKIMKKKNQTSYPTKERVMSKSREQGTASKKVDDTYKKALVASATYETANADFMRSDFVAKKTKEIAKKAKGDARKADAEYLAAVKAALVNDKAAYIAAERAAKKPVNQAPPLPILPFPTKDAVYEDDNGYATDLEGYQYLDPDANPIPVEDMFRKIERQDWNA